MNETKIIPAMITCPNLSHLPRARKSFVLRRYYVISFPNTAIHRLDEGDSPRPPFITLQVAELLGGEGTEKIVFTSPLASANL